MEAKAELETFEFACAEPASKTLAPPVSTVPDRKLTTEHRFRVDDKVWVVLGNDRPTEAVVTGTCWLVRSALQEDVLRLAIQLTPESDRDPAAVRSISITTKGSYAGVVSAPVGTIREINPQVQIIPTGQEFSTQSLTPRAVGDSVDIDISHYSFNIGTELALGAEGWRFVPVKANAQTKIVSCEPVYRVMARCGGMPLSVLDFGEGEPCSGIPEKNLSARASKPILSLD